MQDSSLTPEDWVELEEFVDVNTLRLCKLYETIHNELPPPLFHKASYSFDTQISVTKRWRAFYTTAQWEAWNYYFQVKEKENESL